MPKADFSFSTLQTEKLREVCPFVATFDHVDDRWLYNSRSIDDVYSLVCMSVNRIDVCLLKTTLATIDLTTGLVWVLSSEDASQFSELAEKILLLDIV